MESSGVEQENGFIEALGQATEEYKGLYKGNLKFIRGSAERASAVNMVFMRARDIEKAKSVKNGKQLFTFTITAFDLENRRWDKCPGCGDPDINQQSASGHPWQGCRKCEVLLGSNGTIKAMDPLRGKGAK